jgi:hypothetical protein
VGGARHEVSRLKHHGIAVTQRRRDLPGRDRNREIPGRNDADDANRLTSHLDLDAGPHTRDLLAHQPQRLAGEEIENLTGPGHLSDTFGAGLAFLARQKLAKLFLARHDFIGNFLQRIMTLLRRRARPAGRGRLRCSDGGACLSRIGLRVFSDDVIGIRRIDVARDGRAGDPLAADEILVMDGHGWCFPDVSMAPAQDGVELAGDFEKTGAGLRVNLLQGVTYRFRTDNAALFHQYLASLQSALTVFVVDQR